jgi:hypothetical protein
MSSDSISSEDPKRLLKKPVSRQSVMRVFAAYLDFLHAAVQEHGEET